VQLNSLSDNIRTCAAPPGRDRRRRERRTPICNQIAAINSRSRRQQRHPTTANLLDQRDKYIDELSADGHPSSRASSIR
jgi:hypothetical protein